MSKQKRGRGRPKGSGVKGHHVWVRVRQAPELKKLAEADGSVDLVASHWLYHEMPPKAVRRLIGLFIHTPPRHFRAVDFNQAVVDAHPHQCGQHMFHCTHFGPIFLDGGAPTRIGHEVAIGFDDGLSGQVDPLKLVAKARVGRS